MDLESRRELLEVFQRYPGSQAALERYLNISHTSLWGWFRGKFNSQRIEQAVVEVAAKLEANGKP